MDTLDSVHVDHTCLADFQVVVDIQSLEAFHDRLAADLVDIVGRKASTVDSCLVDIGLKRENNWNYDIYYYEKSNMRFCYFFLY